MAPRTPVSGSTGGAATAAAAAAAGAEARSEEAKEAAKAQLMDVLDGKMRWDGRRNAGVGWCWRGQCEFHGRLVVGLSSA